MAISLKHAFVSAKADGLDTTKVQPSNWNAEHNLTMATARVLGRVTAGTGAVEELTAAQLATFIGVPDISNIPRLIVTKAATSGTTVDFTEVDAAYSDYFFVLRNVSGDGAPSRQLLMRTSIDGGATYQSTDYKYASRRIGMFSGSAETLEASNVSTSFPLSHSAGSIGVEGRVDVFNANAGVSRVTVDTVHSSFSEGTVFWGYKMSGATPTSGLPQDGFRFYWSVGNFSGSGEISMYGVPG